MGASRETVCYRCGRPRRVISSGGRSLCGSCYNVSPDRPHRRCGLCNKVAAICVRATARHLTSVSTATSCRLPRARPAGVTDHASSSPSLPDLQEVPPEGSGDLCALRRESTSHRALGRGPCATPVTPPRCVGGESATTAGRSGASSRPRAGIDDVL